MFKIFLSYLFGIEFQVKFYWEGRRIIDVNWEKRMLKLEIYQIYVCCIYVAIDLLNHVLSFSSNMGKKATLPQNQPSPGSRTSLNHDETLHVAFFPFCFLLFLWTASFIGKKAFEWW